LPVIYGVGFCTGGYHIGASGLIYGMFFFFITSALLKRERSIIAFSLIITFLYGAIVWVSFRNFSPEKISHGKFIQPEHLQE
jgi:membrane associated rhomboid family serine protease